MTTRMIGWRSKRASHLIFKMEKRSLKFGILGGLSEAVYCALVCLFFIFGEHWFKEAPQYLISLIMLLLFVVSAGISGLFVLGFPANLALQGKIKEGIYTFFISLLTILAIFLIFIIVLLLIKNL